MNRAERRSKKQAVINKRLKELKQIDRHRYSYLCTKNRVNSLSKQDAHDCGNTACPLCSGEKLYGSTDNRGYKTTDSNTYRGDIEDIET